MEAVKHPEELERKLGAFTSVGTDQHFTYSGPFGQFEFKVEHYGDFSAIRHEYKSLARSLTIPLTCERPSIQMMFSIGGQSVYRDKFNPYVLSSLRHSLNYFNNFDCRNLLREGSKQNDIVFALGEEFYRDIISDSYEEAANGYIARVRAGDEFNTINQHLPVDAGIQGLLRNILDCPYTGKVKTLFMREHLRSLLLLQFFHFNYSVTGAMPSPPKKLTSRDRDTLMALKEHIDENFLDTTSLLQLSRQFGINEFKLKSGFRSLFNISPIRYLQLKRLELGLLLLKETDRPINEIAREIGYGHPNNFSLAFRRTYGRSPQFYRSKVSIEK